MRIVDWSSATARHLLIAANKAAKISTLAGQRACNILQGFPLRVDAELPFRNRRDEKQ
jgi:hypothetical protein